MQKRKDDWRKLNTRIPKQAFPRDLARVVAERWNTICGGEYITPPCPPPALLRSLLEIAYLTGSAPEEDRFPQFNIVATPGDDLQGQSITKWSFDEEREFSVSELRRLVPAIDVRKSAIWVVWSTAGWRVKGLIDFGTSWHRTRIGLGYNYQQPSSLIVEVDRPGRVKVCQGTFHVATLSDGEIEGYRGIDMHLSLHDPGNRGLKAMHKKIIPPTFENEREWYGFEFIAIWNTFVGIANTISIAGHGGALVIVPSESELSTSISIKYRSSSNVLQDAFISFINARHVVCDLIAKQEAGKKIKQERISHADLKMSHEYDLLVEATRFVARLSGCDGAIVVSDDLRLLGFGAEITAPLKEGISVMDIEDSYDEFNGSTQLLNPNQFGMRHRSAIKLISQEENWRMLVISQDGPISAIWAKDRNVLVRRGLKLVNMNTPWAA